MINHLRLLLAVAIGLSVAPVALAQPITITNAGFELPAAGPGTFSGSQTAGPPGWSVYNTGPTNSNRFFGVWNPTGTTSFNLPVPQGQRIGVVFLDDSLGLEAGLTQTLGSTLQLSTAYTMNVGVGNFRPSVGDPWDFTGFPGYRVELRAGGELLAADNNTLLPSEGTCLTSTVSFTTGSSHLNAGQALSIHLVSLNGPGVEVNFDDVRLVATPVPEPSSVLVIAGIACSVFIRRHLNTTAKSSR